MDNDDLAVKYLEQELKHLVRNEAHYLIEGFSYALRRLRGEEPKEEDFEESPSMSFDEFKRTHGIKESMRRSIADQIEAGGSGQPYD